MTDDWDLIGFVISSQYRLVVLRQLTDGPASPSMIADESGHQISHISRALNELRARSLVELLVPEDRKKGRIYGLTEQGALLWEEMDSLNMV